MDNIFPVINQKIKRLGEIQNNMDLWNEIEKLNKELAEVD
jgi:hypothetical protein